MKKLTVETEIKKTKPTQFKKAIHAFLWILIAIYLGSSLSKYEETAGILEPSVNTYSAMNEHKNYPLYSIASNKVYSSDFGLEKEFDLHKNISIVFLCKLNIIKNCYNYDPVDVIDQLYSLQIIYSYHPEQMPLLYNYSNYFKWNLASIGIKSIVLESIRTDIKQDYVLTIPNNEPWDIQVINNEKFYKRENLLNVAVKKMENLDWEYIVWIDAHQIFDNPYWWHESIVKFEKYNSVQLFQKIYVRDKHNQTHFWPSYSFNEWASYLADLNRELKKPWGNAWGLNRETYNKIGTIVDICFVGCCDCAYAMAGVSAPLENISMLGSTEHYNNYWKFMSTWILKARAVFKNKRAVIRGSLTHLDHERTFNYLEGQKYVSELYGRLDLENGLVRDENMMLTLNDIELASLIHLLTIQAN